MEEDNTSTEVVESTTPPESDKIAEILEDTEDPNPVIDREEVVETPEVKATEDETPSEGEQEPEEQTEEVETEVDPKEEARRRYEARQAAIQERKQRVAKASEEHLKGAEDEYDERLRAMESENYARTVEHTENTLINEFERAKTSPELQIFNPESPEFNQKAYDKAMRDYNAGYVTYDTYGNMVGIKGSLYEHLTETAELLQGAVKSGAVQQVRATRKMQSNADTKPAATPKETAKDPILDILNSD